MIKNTGYHTDWQNNRINFILSKYPKEFFNGKRILELGAHNGYIGAYFSTLGSVVHCVEGRIEYYMRNYKNPSEVFIDMDINYNKI